MVRATVRVAIVAGMVMAGAAAVVAGDPPRGVGAGEVQEILRAREQAIALINQATSQRLTAVAGRLQESGDAARALEVYRAAYRLDRGNRAAAGALARAGVKLEDIKPDEPGIGVPPAAAERGKRPEEKLPRGEGEGGEDRPRGEAKERRGEGAREEGGPRREPGARGGDAEGGEGAGERGRRDEKPRLTDEEINRLLKESEKERPREDRK